MSVIILVFAGSILGGMILFCFFACCYRHLLERFIYPIDYKARKKANRRRKERDEEDERELKDLKEDEEKEKIDKEKREKEKDIIYISADANNNKTPSNFYPHEGKSKH